MNAPLAATDRSGVKSVPPRDSGWVRSISPLKYHDSLRTHPLPRGVLTLY